MTSRRQVVAVADSGYLAEVVDIATSSGVRLDAVMGEGHALTIAARVGLAVVSDRIDPTALPGSCDVVVAIGSAPARERFTASISADHTVRTLVHRDATVGAAIEIGDGSIVSPGARLVGVVTIGRHCLIHTSAVVSHDDVLGDHVTISPSATLTGSVEVGDRVSVGAGATILPGIKIGHDAVIGAGALVNRDVDAATTVAGVPARTLDP